MTKPSTFPKQQPASAPALADVAPKNAAERQLHALILEGLSSGLSTEVSIAELCAELRQRLNSKP